MFVNLKVGVFYVHLKFMIRTLELNQFHTFGYTFVKKLIPLLPFYLLCFCFLQFLYIRILQVFHLLYLFIQHDYSKRLGEWT